MHDVNINTDTMPEDWKRSSENYAQNEIANERMKKKRQQYTATYSQMAEQQQNASNKCKKKRSEEKQEEEEVEKRLKNTNKDTTDIDVINNVTFRG